MLKRKKCRLHKQQLSKEQYGDFRIEMQSPQKDLYYFGKFSELVVGFCRG